MDNLVIYGQTYNNVEGFKAKDTNDVVHEFYSIEDATLNSNGQLLNGVTAYGANGKFTGNIQTRTSSNLTASGATVTVPAGYYASQATKSVSNGSATTPATTVTANPTISVNSSGLITATVSGTKSVTPTVSAGYVSSGTAGTITVSGSNTEQLSAQAAKTVTPTESAQTAVASGKYTTGAVTVAAIPSNYIGSGVSFVTYYTGSSAPASSLGSNGDIYLKTS